MVPTGKTLIDYEEALEQLSQDESFRATVYAMNIAYSKRLLHG